MVVDAVRTYLDAASGLTELSRKQAVAAAKALLRANGPAAPAAAEGESLPPRVGQSIQNLAGELIETSQANRAAIAELVRSEVGRQLERMDVVPRADHERLVRRVAELERRLAARHAVERVLAPVEAGASSSVRPAAAAEADGSGAGVSAGAGAADGSGEGGAGSGAESGSVATEGAAKAAGARGAQEADDDGADASADGAGTAADDGADAQHADKPAAGKPRTAAKTARARTAAKRSTKSRGATKK
ncbi:membrane fusogenic activity family protein [Nocardiopsis akebiae]|uniref:Membrane fusogenic activity family protein n=1 Tax=Nocardiopsis akebiae TaxID=2831968 RepID=A0ABX8C8W3_9ACTN|nr:membrane fusogenic activity family protein [Nocardiopsis akebiae]QUX30866.1 membrane fusogenic activity family protein [Nocardiopsis akebiae]